MSLEFHFDFHGFRLVLQAIKRRDDISVFFFTKLIREFIHRLVGDADDVGRRIQIDLLPFFKTIDYITLRIRPSLFWLWVPSRRGS